MREFEIRGRDDETCIVSYGGGVPGHVLITVLDTHNGCNGFFAAKDARKIAAALLRVADDSEETP